jgi:D-amino acid aminotransferase
MKALYNGSIIDEANAVLPITDKAVWFDFGVYESIKVIQGKAFYPERHIGRFFHSAELVSMQMGFSQSEVLKWTDKFIAEEKLDNALLRLFAYGDTEKNLQARIYIFALGLTFYPNMFYSQGATAITHPGERFLPQSKSFNMLLNFLVHKKAQEQKAIEALLVDREGFVTEGTRSNLFIIEKDQIIITPPAQDVLSGVTRDLLIEWAGEKGISIRQEKISRERLYNGAEVIITSTGMNIMPIVLIDEKKIGAGTVGKKTRELHLLFREKQREYFKK